jgi:hypothetical protein
MTTAYVTEWANFTDLYEHGAVGLFAERHARLKQNVRTSLAGEFPFERRIGRLGEHRSESRLVIRREKHNDCSRLSERCLQYLSHVR